MLNDQKVTGYTIYKAEQERRTKRNDLPEFYPDLPDKKYDIIPYLSDKHTKEPSANAKYSNSK